VVLPTVAEVRSWDVDETIEHLEKTFENFTMQDAATFKKYEIDGYACLTMTVENFLDCGVGAKVATRIANYTEMIKQERTYLFKGTCFLCLHHKFVMLSLFAILTKLRASYASVIIIFLCFHRPQ